MCCTHTCMQELLPQYIAAAHPAHSSPAFCLSPPGHSPPPTPHIPPENSTWGHPHRRALAPPDAHHNPAHPFLCSEGKAACKEALQKELGLPVNKAIPLVAFIGRLDPQKGADLVLGAAPWLMQQDVQLVCLGTGSAELEDGLRWLEFTYKWVAGLVVGGVCMC